MAFEIIIFDCYANLEIRIITRVRYDKAGFEIRIITRFQYDKAGSNWSSIRSEDWHQAFPH